MCKLLIVASYNVKFLKQNLDSNAWSYKFSFIVLISTGNIPLAKSPQSSFLHSLDLTLLIPLSPLSTGRSLGKNTNVSNTNTTTGVVCGLLARVMK